MIVGVTNDELHLIYNLCVEKHRGFRIIMKMLFNSLFWLAC